jgi:hypothetical protein
MLRNAVKLYDMTCIRVSGSTMERISVYEAGRCNAGLNGWYILPRACSVSAMLNCYAYCSFSSENLQLDFHIASFLRRCQPIKRCQPPP